MCQEIVVHELCPIAPHRPVILSSLWSRVGIGKKPVVYFPANRVRQCHLFISRPARHVVDKEAGSAKRGARARQHDRGLDLAQFDKLRRAGEFAISTAAEEARWQRQVM